MAVSPPDPGPAPLACDVVLLEDDDLLRLTLAELLEEQGCRVHPAAAGDEALAAVEGLHGACVLVADRALRAAGSWQDGHAVAAAALARWPALRAIYISGAPDPTDRALTAREARLLKPFDLGVMLGLLRALTGGPAAR